MPLEDRYMTFKIRDLNGWSKGSFVKELFGEYMLYRMMSNKAPLLGIFVEADWPEFEHVKDAVLKRHGGKDAGQTDAVNGVKADVKAQPVVTKHSHYFKDVQHLDTVDVYRILKLFNVTDPCLQHAIKKLLVAGGRGAGKSIERDLREAGDSINRALQMIAEDDRAQHG